MAKLRLGLMDYINCMPVYHALEEGQLPFDAEIFKASPARLNKLFLNGELDITPLSSIEYARHANECFILPNMSITVDGKAESVVLFSSVPVTELEGKKVAIVSSAATSIALLKILFEHYYHVEVEYLITKNSDLDNILTDVDAALLIGDEAMIANQRVKDDALPYTVTDLGAAWKEFTGQKMVFSIWAIREGFANNNPIKIANMAEIFQRSKLLGIKQLPTLIDIARRKSGLPQEVLEQYFQLFDYEFDNENRQALITFYDYAYKSGLIEERVKLNIWNENLIK